VSSFRRQDKASKETGGAKPAPTNLPAPICFTVRQRLPSQLTTRELCMEPRSATRSLNVFL
jgi:hypothetical protein